MKNSSNFTFWTVFYIKICHSEKLIITIKNENKKKWRNNQNLLKKGRNAEGRRLPVKHLLKTSQNAKKSKFMTTLWVCAQQQLLGVPTEGQLLVLLHCANERIGDMCYDNRTTFHCLVPGGQGKNIYFRNVHFWLFAYRLVREGLSQGVASTITTFLETTWKLSSTTLIFHFSVTSSLRDELVLKIHKILSINAIFWWPAPPKMIQWRLLFDMLLTVSISICLSSFSLCTCFIQK